MRLPETAVRVPRRLAEATEQRGPFRVATSCLTWQAGWVLGRLGATQEVRGSFTWRGEEVPYFRDPYHYTWLNERSVEVALARRVLAEHPGASVLEIGNVTRHYLPVDHPVVDKYEHGPGVTNLDVVDLDVEQEYDLVLAISTLEHVGLDEDVLDPGKPGRAVAALVRALRPGGLLWMTVPVGYNPDLDRDLRDGGLGFTRLEALRRQPHRNLWREVPLADVWTTPYDRFLYTAHGLVVAEYRKPPRPPRPRSPAGPRTAGP